MRIPVISDWLDALAARKEADETAEKEKAKRQVLRQKATTEQRQQRACTDTVFGAVGEATIALNGNGKHTAREVPDEETPA